MKIYAIEVLWLEGGSYAPIRTSRTMDEAERGLEILKIKYAPYKPRDMRITEIEVPENPEERFRFVLSLYERDGCFAEEELRDFSAQIFWGDWKHEHGRLDDLMRMFGFELISEECTEENGSDCYSAIHTYREVWDE